MLMNWKSREMNLKIVYYGPGLSGKTTNVKQIYSRINPNHRGELLLLDTLGERTVCFDFLEVNLGKIRGFTPKLHLYTVPGQQFYEATRRLVVNGADGVVFVVDSTTECLEENRRSWTDLKKHLHCNGLTCKRVPIVFQFNKQDLRSAMDPADLIRGMRITQYPWFGAAAVEGRGISETLKAISSRVIDRAEAGMYY